MNANQHHECYGKLFPDFEHLNYNQPTEGKAFRVFVEKIGIVVQRREVHVKQDEWEKCEDCPSFESCYNLSAAKSLLWQGLLVAA